MYIQSISMYLSPPVVTVYFLGVLWKRANTQVASPTLPFHRPLHSAFDTPLRLPASMAERVPY